MASPPHIARANGMKGGRPPGRKNNRTLELEKEALKQQEVKDEYQQRVMENVNGVILNAQLKLAQGLTYLWKIEKLAVKGPRGGTSYKPQPPKIVEDVWEQQAYLMGQIDSFEVDKGPGATYYYLTVTPPNPSAIRDLLDRTLHKATAPAKDGDSKNSPVTANKISFQSYGKTTKPRSK